MGLFFMRTYSICDPRSPKQPQGGPGHLPNAQGPHQHPTKKRGISKQGTYPAPQAKKRLEHSPRDSRQPKGRRGQGGGLWSPPHLRGPTVTSSGPTWPQADARHTPRAVSRFLLDRLSGAAAFLTSRKAKGGEKKTACSSSAGQKQSRGTKHALQCHRRWPNLPRETVQRWQAR